MASKSVQTDDPRLGTIIQNINSHSLKDIAPQHILLGHADEEGICLNNGRPGSARAPNAIREQLLKLTPGRKDFPSVSNVGNLNFSGPLIERQTAALKFSADAFNQNHRLLALGGGHDHAFSDIGGFLECFGKKRPIVVNLDAHLDLRPVQNTPTSGTPFFQLIEKYPPFELVEIGIQPHSSSLTHHEYAKNHKVKVFSFAKSHGQLAKIFKSLRAGRRPFFLSIDIDAFSSAFAPGSSAASPIGFDPSELLDLMPWIATQLNVRGFGIYEVSPPLDIDNRTAKLAAILLHSYLLHVKK